MTAVCGRPVYGEVEHYRTPKAEQVPIEDFVAALDKLFESFPDVEKVRWTQYTPSFNDGDPCVFGVGEVRVKLVGGDEEAGGYEDGFLDNYDVCRHYGGEWNWQDKASNHPLAVLLDAEFDYGALDKYEDALEDAFGDPAEVTATREGFYVEYYDCGY